MTRLLARLCALGAVAAVSLVMAPAASGAATITSVSGADHIVSVEWTLPAGESASMVETSTSPDFPEDSGLTEFVQPDATSVTFGTPLPGGVYYVRVVTCDAADPPCLPVYSSAEVVSVPSDAATLLSVSLAGGVFSATWTLPTAASAWSLEISPNFLRTRFGFTDRIFEPALAFGETSYSTQLSLPPGLYYVHVKTTPRLDLCLTVINGCAFEYSNIGSFRVGPSAPPSSGAPSSAGTADKSVVVGSFAASRQDVDKLAVTLTLGEPVNVRLSGSVNVPGASKVYRFRTVNRSLGAGRRKLSLKLAGRAKRAVKRALRRKRKLRAKLVLRVTDAAGNSRTKRYSVRLRP